MKTNEQLEIWKKRVGLISVDLFYKDLHENTNQHLLLNGSKGNFCLNFDEIDIDENSLSWSSNVDFFLNVDKENTHVMSWDNQIDEKYTNKSIINNIEKFHEFLCDVNIRKEFSIIALALKTFRNLRRYIDKKNEKYLLFSFLQIISSIRFNSDVDEDLLHNYFNLELDDKFLFFVKSKKDIFEVIKRAFVNGFDNFNLRPDINLVLRHAMGEIFQETNLEISYITNNQSSLFDIGHDYTTKLPRSFTSYYTPSYVVRHIVEDVIREFLKKNKINEISNITIMDPACGSGEFLKESIRQLRNIGYKNKIKLIGYDITINAVAMTNFMLNNEKIHDEKIDFNIKQTDALDEDWDNNIDVILMNPPFQMWESLNNHQKDHLKDICKNVIQGRFNLSAAFLFLALKTLKPDGVLGSVIPTFILDGNAYQKLREFIFDNMEIKLIAKLGSQQMFSSAMADASIITLVNSKNTKMKPTFLYSRFIKSNYNYPLKEYRKSQINNTSLPYFQNDIDIYDVELNDSEDLWLPVPFKSRQLRNELKNNYSPLNDIFVTRQGIITGYNKVFVISKEEYESYSDDEKVYFMKAALNDSINDGALSDDFYVFYPYINNEIKDEDELQRKVYKYYHYKLKPNEKQLRNRNLTNWWELTRKRDQNIIQNKKIITKKFGTIGSFAFDENGEYIPIEGSYLFFNEEYKNKIQKTQYYVDDFYYAYLAVLSMPIIIDILEGISKQLAGGKWYYLAVKFINEIHLPNLWDYASDKIIQNNPDIDKSDEYYDSINIFDKLVNLGNRIAKDTSIDELSEELNLLQNIIFPTYEK